MVPNSMYKVLATCILFVFRQVMLYGDFVHNVLGLAVEAQQSGLGKDF